MFEIFNYDFMIRAMIAGCLTAVAAPVAGLFLVVRRYSNMADTLAHVGLLGVALALVFHVHYLVGALAVVLVAAGLIEYLRGKRILPGDTLLSLFLSGSLALAVVIISSGVTTPFDITTYLFGSITTVTWTDVIFMAIVTVVTIVICFIGYRYFFLISLDERLARADGVRTRWYGMTLTFLGAFIVVLGMPTVGVLLIGALMVIPVSTALQFRLSFKKTMLLGVVFSLLSALIGIFSSYYLDLATGGTIVIIACIFFLISVVIRKFRFS
ncbi:metal ABC transporter permease [Candidatus Gracilibacteria bacterium]|nr:metal ABC transporter permease [Candidatus Gracilibacteria bacterium]